MGDFFEEMVELEVLEDLLDCGRCRGRCQCSGRNHLGQLLEVELEVEIIEDLGGW